jgi:TPR repeat protein
VSAATYGSAIEWFRKASDLGSMEACHNLGVAYEYGTHGLAKDYAQAEEYYRKAAAAGYMPSQYNLGGLYANNRISPPNDVEGLKWLMLAQMSAEQDKDQPLSHWVLEDLPGNKSRLEMRLSDAQLQEARKLAEEWKATGPKAK